MNENVCERQWFHFDLATVLLFHFILTLIWLSGEPLMQAEVLNTVQACWLGKPFEE